MKQEEEATTFSSKLENHLNGPLPLLRRLRNFVFGKHQPDGVTKIIFYFHLILWVIFFFWSMLQLIVLKNRDWIAEIKRIPVTELLNQRAQTLGFESIIFIDRLQTNYSIALFLWSSYFVGLVLLWRKKMYYTYVIFTVLIAYLFTPLLLLGWTYWTEDISTFDKIILLSTILITVTYTYFIKQSLLSKSTQENQLKDSL
jgi:hypothetical protein|uniref:hypothetical protein n=1 Tax=Fluviicola sp. TaxID=1917219 RepID=UPI0040496D41